MEQPFTIIACGLLKTFEIVNGPCGGEFECCFRAAAYRYAVSISFSSILTLIELFQLELKSSAL